VKYSGYVSQTMIATLYKNATFIGCTRGDTIGLKQYLHNLPEGWNTSSTTDDLIKAIVVPKGWLAHPGDVIKMIGQYDLLGGEGAVGRLMLRWYSPTADREFPLLDDNFSEANPGRLDITIKGGGASYLYAVMLMQSEEKSRYLTTSGTPGYNAQDGGEIRLYGRIVTEGPGDNELRIRSAQTDVKFLGENSF
jgi:hypothetical protein